MNARGYCGDALFQGDAPSLRGHALLVGESLGVSCATSRKGRFIGACLGETSRSIAGVPSEDRRDIQGNDGDGKNKSERFHHFPTE